MENWKKLEEILLKLPHAHTCLGDEIRLRCPICNKPDDKLYVGPMKNDQFSKEIKLGYNCKQCQYSGIVGKKFLEKLGINYDGTIKDLTKYDPTPTTVKSINPATKLKKLDLKIPNWINPKDQFKVDYLSNRFNRDITVEDLITYKIVLNFRDLLEFNKLKLLEFEDKNDVKRCDFLRFQAKQYSDHFVGMLTLDNNKINFRNINSKYYTEKGKRYMVHVINKNISNPYLYMVSNPINLLTPNPIINMAEGNYDIIGARELYFKDNVENNCVFVAIGTRTAYKRSLSQILKMTGFFNAKINIFADNDKDTNLGWYKDMFKEWKYLFPEITINYNIAKDKNGNDCKDFGNLSNPVELKKFII